MVILGHGEYEETWKEYTCPSGKMSTKIERYRWGHDGIILGASKVQSKGSPFHC